MNVQSDAYRILPTEKLFKLENFGHSISSPAYLFRPTQVAEVALLIEAAQRYDFKIGLRGAGRSYGDAALNSGQVVLDFSRMNRILAWDPFTGVIKVEPGVTIEQLWRHTLEDGWWSPVTPGTMKPTFGGCLAANVHGKNNWKTGTIGEHVLTFTALLANGKEVTCSPVKNKDLFYAMIGGMGMLGVFTSITYQMKPIYSGNLNAYAWAEPTFGRVLGALEEHQDNDYVIGWVDGTARGKRLGRGQMHAANYPKEGEDTDAAHTLHPNYQDLPSSILGIVPRSIVWRGMSLGMNNLGAWGGNTAKYWMSRTLSHKKHYSQPLVAFTYLLDYVPDWELSYGRRGMIQYQSFLPKDTALEVYQEVLLLCKRRRLPSYLGVVKRHRPDDFLFSHAVDGYSLALDFKVTNRNLARLRKLTHDLNRIVLSGNGRFYFAKDSTLTPDVVQAYLGEETIKKFRRLKTKHDPNNIFQTDLYRRCFGAG